MAKLKRVSLVSGAGRGIGLVIAQFLAQRGDKLALIDSLFNDPAHHSHIRLAKGLFHLHFSAIINNHKVSSITRMVFYGENEE